MCSQLPDFLFIGEYNLRVPTLTPIYLIVSAPIQEYLQFGKIGVHEKNHRRVLGKPLGKTVILVYDTAGGSLLG